MKILSENQRMTVLLILGGCVVAALVFVILFGFKIETEKPKMKVGFVITGDIHEAGWSASHYNGIKAACDDFGMELLVKDHVKENTGQCPKAIEELIAQGAEIIFLTSFNYPSEAREIIDKNPNIPFMDISMQETAKNLTACFARMYQGRYLAGALAGMKTKSNVLGYVAAIPNSEVCRGINAFTLGAQKTNPDAKVFVMWTGDWQNEEIEKANAKRLIEETGADVLTYHQNEAATADVAESYGVDFIGFNAMLEGYSEHYLTSIICRWDLFYKDVFQQYFKGELNSVRYHWMGVTENVITLSDYSPSVTQEMKTKIAALENELRDSKPVFSDEIYDNEGNLRCVDGQSLSDDDLLQQINWLVKGVEVIE